MMEAYKILTNWKQDPKNMVQVVKYPAIRAMGEV